LTRGAYENKAQLYFARLLDSTRVAIEVGRERMGTDNAPEHELPCRKARILDQGQRPARREDHPVPSDDPGVLEVAKAAATAESFREFRRGPNMSTQALYRQGAG
jgi:hypothetical protein